MAVQINNEWYSRMNCGQCGIVFFVPQAFYEDRINDGDEWKCPNGHTRVFSEPKVQKLEKIVSTRDKEIATLKSDALTHKWGIQNRDEEIAKLRARVKRLNKKVKAGA